MKSHSLTELLRNSDLRSTLARYLPDPDSIKGRFEHHLRSLASRRFVVPVAGLQGTGKSTFLNALLFDEPVLPVDADETTCVPVEIQHGVSGARIHFKDGRVQEVDASETALKEFVHQEHNPENVRGISKVVIGSNASILDTGIVLVDLPGVGSLTPENAETTRRYLEEAVGVIFMVRTVPPITRSEALFITTWWACLPTAVFVQNRWTDESAEEAESGREANLRVLRALLQTNRLSRQPDLHVLNAYRALEGRLTGRPEVTASSGMPSFLEQMRALADGWPEAVFGSAKDAVLADIGRALGTVEDGLADARRSSSEGKAKLEDTEREFNSYFEQADAKVADGVRTAETAIARTGVRIGEWKNEAAKRLRNAMRGKLRAGIVDGPRLDRALEQEQSVEADELLGLVQTEMLQLQDELRGKFEDLGSWRSSHYEGRFKVGAPERRKYEAVLPHLAQAGGAVAAGWAAGVGGAKAGAALGAWGGPVGMAVGGVVGGIVGGLFGWWAGSKAKKLALERRASAVESAVMAAIQSFVEGSASHYVQVLEQGRADIRQQLSEWLGRQRAEYERERDRIAATLRMNLEERERNRDGLERDRATLQSWMQTASEGAR